jgi:hypothetical protein
MTQSGGAYFVLPICPVCAIAPIIVRMSRAATMLVMS